MRSNLTDENITMFGLIMSKLNSVRIGKLVIDGVVKGRRGGSQAEEVRWLETHHHG